MTSSTDEDQYSRQMAMRELAHMKANEKCDSQVHIVAQEVPSPEDDLQIHWQPGIKSRFPWLGFAALLTMVIGIGCTVLILVTSKGKIAEQWPSYQKWNWIDNDWKSKAQLKPSTALAIVNTITNLALAVAIGNGVAIAWWRKALQGATVTDLHKSWAVSTSAFELLTAGKYFNVIALCALTAKLALVDNVLLQQSTGTEPWTYSRNVTNLRLPIVRELPADFAGTWSSDGSTGALTNAFADNLWRYFSSPGKLSLSELGTEDVGDIIDDFTTLCDGICTFNVEAFGVNVTCDEPELSEYTVTRETVGAANDLGSLNDETFDTSITTSTLASTFFIPMLPNAPDSVHPEPYISMSVEYADISSNGTETDSSGASALNNVQSCQGTLQSRQCVIRPAVVNYSVAIYNSAQSLTSESGLVVTEEVNLARRYTAASDYDGGILKDGQVWENKVVASAYQIDSEKYNNVMLSIYNVLYTSFRTSVKLQYLNGTGFVAKPDSGFMGQWWAQSQSMNYFPRSCVMNVSDPSAWIVTQLNSLLFRAAISGAQNNTIAFPDAIRENITGRRSTDTVAYTSNWAFAGAAIAMVVICILCVLPSYYGFWELGRKVTLGPMEIASAFQAPALSAPVVGAGGEVEMVLKEVGQRRVRYGVVGSGKLAMAEANETIRLKKGIPVRNGNDL